MLIKIRRQLLLPFRSVISTKQRMLAGALAVAVVAIACGSDSGSPAAGGNTPDPAAPTSVTSPDGSVTRSPDAAPSFVVDTFSHGTYDLNAAVGRPVVINFWFPSCPPLPC